MVVLPHIETPQPKRSGSKALLKRVRGSKTFGGVFPNSVAIACFVAKPDGKRSA
jgi:hypothetical protein